MLGMIGKTRTLAAGVVLICVAITCRTAADTKSVRDYLREPDFQEVELSPLGDRLAVTQLRGLTEALLVVNVADGKVLSATQFGERVGIANFMWANNDRLLIEPSNWFIGFLDAKIPTGEILGLNYNGRGLKMLFGYRAGDAQVGSHIKKVKAEFAAADVIDRLPAEQNKILINKWPYSKNPQNPNRPNNEAMLLDIRSGQARRLAVSPIRYGNFVLDRKNEINLVYGVNEKNRYEAYIRKGGSGEFTKIESEFDGDEYITPVLASGDGDYWALGYGSGDKAGVFKWNPQNNTYEEIFRHKEVDAGQLLTGPNEDVYAIRYHDHYPAYHYPDPKHPLALAHMGVAKAFPASDVRFLNFSDDAKKAVLRVSGPRQPTEFMLVDVVKNKLSPLLKSRPWLAADDLVSMEPFELTARDGTKMRGYFTLPRGEKKNLPFVVFPHGGPHGVQDTWGFNPEVQLLASRGYGVLQVNYRGSGGQGWAFERSGYRQWGAAMQDDITDATRWLIDEGLADPERLCIMGASYGGYAALNAVATEPELYKCAIGRVGVYDLPLMLSRGDIPQSNAGEAYLDRVLGSDIAQLRSRSPVYNAEKIKAKVFLAHGEQDQRVPVEHANRMRAALEAAGNPPEWMLKRGEAHGFYAEDNLIELYNRILAFLETHIGG